MTGREFRDLRKSMGMRQHELARLMDCTRQQISHLENRETIPVLYEMAIQHLENTGQSIDAAA